MNEALYLRNPEQSELAKYHYAQHCNDPRKMGSRHLLLKLAKDNGEGARKTAQRHRQLSCHGS
jgi:hypothetical protein